MTKNVSPPECVIVTIRSRRGGDLVFDQAKMVVVASIVVFLTAGVACDGAPHRADAEDHGQAGRAGVGVFPFHLPAF